jgi:hypothetical protein
MFFVYMAYLNHGAGQATEPSVGPLNPMIVTYPTVL